MDAMQTLQMTRDAASGSQVARASSAQTDNLPQFGGGAF